MKVSNIRQELHPVLGYFAFLVFATLFVCYIIPTFFVYLLKFIKIEDILITYSLFYSFKYTTVYLLAVFFISISHIAVPNSRVEGWVKGEYYFITGSCSRIERWFEETLLGCLFWIALHYIFISFIIFYFFTDLDYLKSEQAIGLPPFIVGNFNFTLLLLVTCIYFITCIFIVAHSFLTKTTLIIFQRFLWKINDA